MIKLEDDFYKEEIRCGFRVTEKRKRCWAVVLNLLHEFDIFANEYNLKYFTGFGTLLGAVRHKGFIPWDDDIDIVMTRDEYMKMGPYAREYFNGREIGGRRLVFEDAYSENTVLKSYFSKIRDCETTMAEPFMVNNGTWAGMSIDIFPVDAMYDGTDETLKNALIRSELWLSFVQGHKGIDSIKEILGGESILGDSLLSRICALPMDERMRMFENHSLSMWGKSKKVGDMIKNLISNGQMDSKFSSWQESCRLPFENTEVPAPAGWDDILSALYGDYNEYVIGGSGHDNSFYDPDTPFEEYAAGMKTIPEDWDGSL